jgi:hypothetical protein
MSTNTVNIIGYGLIAIWAIFSIRFILRKKRGKFVYAYWYESIPSVFSTLGVFGTFLGIWAGLQRFDVHNINDSIPILLEGMKTAFLTSIIGISGSIIFGKYSRKVAEDAERKKQETESDDELSALNAIVKALQNASKEAMAQHSALINVIAGDTEYSLLAQMQQMNEESHKNSLSLVDSLKVIKETMLENQLYIGKKFDEFSELMRKNNTEALVEVMKNVTEEFNKQMSTLIERLVQENFEELNSSIKHLNTWQQENKLMIERLTAQFTKVSNDFEISSEAIKEISENTNLLTNSNSHLTHLIQELQKVMIDDTKFTQIVNQLTGTIDTLEENTQSFNKTTSKLNEWVKNQMNFNDSVAVLVHKLEDVKNVKDINEVFWKNFEAHINTTMSKLEIANKDLSREIDNMNTEFYSRLNDILRNFDAVLRRVIQKNDF